MKNLLRLQELDLQIETYRERERDIPKQKNKLEVQKQRLNAEIEERHKAFRDLQLEQRTHEKDTEQMQAQILKYQQQLMGIKKNEEYQALLHEIENLKKQVGLKEERIIALMVELDEAKLRLAEDEKRIQSELQEIEQQCARIDEELMRVTHARKELEDQRPPQAGAVDPELLAQYERIRGRRKGGPGVVPLRGQHCSGCNMQVPPQLVNEVLGRKVRVCNHCGRILYDKETTEKNAAGVAG